MLGQLIALYEQIVLVQGTVWGVNSFDQWGVELGKALANRITPELAGDAEPQHDTGTNALIRWYVAPLVRPDRLRPALRVGQQHTDDALAVGRLPTHHQPRATVACVAAGSAQRLRDLHVVDLRQRDLDRAPGYAQHEHEATWVQCEHTVAPRAPDARRRDAAEQRRRHCDGTDGGNVGERIGGDLGGDSASQQGHDDEDDGEPGDATDDGQRGGHGALATVLLPASTV